MNMVPQRAKSLFIASLGNPGSRYAETRHSAGHIVLASLAAYLSTPALTSSRAYDSAKVAHQTDRNTNNLDTFLWECPAYMNASGPPLARSFTRFCNIQRASFQQTWLAEHADTGAAAATGASALSREPLKSSSPWNQPELVVIHDEIELPLGRFKISRGAGKSARGHNGLKSILAESAFSKMDFTRIGIGIGPRPTSRQPDIVAAFVLKRLTSQDIAKLDGLAGPIWSKVVAAMTPTTTTTTTTRTRT